MNKNTETNRKSSDRKSDSGKTDIVINEYYTGTKSLKEKLLNIMIHDLKYEQFNQNERGCWTQG
jgi:hypothetical protein